MVFYKDRILILYSVKVHDLIYKLIFFLNFVINGSLPIILINDESICHKSFPAKQNFQAKILKIRIPAVNIYSRHFPQSMCFTSFLIMESISLYYVPETYKASSENKKCKK